jgi:putative transposase
MNGPKHDTGPNALRRGRVTIPHVDYFVTVCLQPRRAVLVPEIAIIILREAKDLERDGGWTLRSLTVMSDHIHLFFTLRERLTLSQVIARLKTKTQTLVRPQGVDWQSNFYDHRIREVDSIGSVIRYIYLNPYREGIIQQNEIWSYFYCCEADWKWFQGLTDSGQPFPEWLQ